MRIAESLDASLAAMRRIMIDRFEPTIWACFGVIIFLEMQFNNLRFPALHFVDEEWEDRSIREQAQIFVDYLDSHGIAVFGIAILMLVGYVIALTVTQWLRTRASLMFVRGVALEDHRIEANWHAVKAHHQSLFVLSFALKCIALVGHIIAVGAAAGVLIVFGVDEVVSFVGAILFLAPIAIVWTLFMIVLWAIGVLLREFVVPLMWHFDLPCLDAASTLREIIRENVFPFLGFFLALAGFQVVIALASLCVGFMTCFIGFIPVIQHSLLSPLYVMQRAFSIALLESMGDEFKMTRWDEELDAVRLEPTLPDD